MLDSLFTNSDKKNNPSFVTVYDNSLSCHVSTIFEKRMCSSRFFQTIENIGCLFCADVYLVLVYISHPWWLVSSSSSSGTVPSSLPMSKNTQSPLLKKCVTQWRQRSSLMSWSFKKKCISINQSSYFFQEFCLKMKCINSLYNISKE